MKIERNSIIIIQDYDYENIKTIRDVVNTCFTIDSISNILWGNSYYSHLLIIHDAKNNIKANVEKTVKEFCKEIYEKYLPQNITVLNMGEAGMSYIEYQFPKEEDYFK